MQSRFRVCCALKQPRPLPRALNQPRPIPRRRQRNTNYQKEGRQSTSVPYKVQKLLLSTCTQHRLRSFLRRGLTRRSSKSIPSRTKNTSPGRPMSESVFEVQLPNFLLTTGCNQIGANQSISFAHRYNSETERYLKRFLLQRSARMARRCSASPSSKFEL